MAKSKAQTHHTNGLQMLNSFVENNELDLVL